MATPVEKFGQVYQEYAGLAAGRSQGVSKDTRLLLAAMSRANNTGHAIFEDGELRRILGKAMPDGTRRPASRSTVFATIARLRSAGLALSGGGETCVWLPQELWSRGLNNGDMTCPAHRTRRGAWLTNTPAAQSYGFGLDTLQILDLSRL